MISVWLFVGSFCGAFSGVLVARAVGTWVVNQTFRSLNKQMQAAELARAAAEDAITPSDRPAG